MTDIQSPGVQAALNGTQPPPFDLKTFQTYIANVNDIVAKLQQNMDILTSKRYLFKPIYLARAQQDTQAGVNMFRILQSTPTDA